ncbi:TPA: subtilase cytotoxin subunit B [Escherichia coli]|nr:subtilase cytotoxin subunit B [Escherichia coli]HEA8696610.1 subtilase cytotoxin subunit B [Escherichia coli]
MILKSLFVVLFISFNAYANGDDDWTGGKKYGMYSDVTIKDIHTGVVDANPYFCVEVVKTELNVKACLVRGYSIWSSAFETFYNQAMYYYSTGQKIRLYYNPNTWTHPDFSKITQNAIAGFSTCSTDDYCFGPERKPSNN